LDSVMMSTYVAAGVNIILLLGILYPSIVNLLKTRSMVSTLLVTFSSVFLLQNLAAVYFHLVVPYTPAVEFEVLVLTALQTMGFGALFWVTYK
jgi:hypothetical protein